MNIHTYIRHVKKIPKLSKEEEQRLRKIGDIETLVIHNLGLVIQIAIPYRNFNCLDDLIQEGNIALMRAVKHYNPELDTKVSTFAVKRIRARILKTLARKEPTKEVIDLVLRRQICDESVWDDVHRALDKLSNEEREIIELRYLDNRTYTLAQIGRAYNVSAETIRRIEYGAKQKLKRRLL